MKPQITVSYQIIALAAAAPKRRAMAPVRVRAWRKVVGTAVAVRVDRK